MCFLSSCQMQTEARSHVCRPPLRSSREIINFIFMPFVHTLFFALERGNWNLFQQRRIQTWFELTKKKILSETQKEKRNWKKLSCMHNPAFLTGQKHCSSFLRSVSDIYHICIHFLSVVVVVVCILAKSRHYYKQTWAYLCKMLIKWIFIWLHSHQRQIEQ